MLSVIIPSRNEKYLEKTIREVLTKARGEIEVLPVLDGWIPDPQIITNDDRVRFIHNPEAIGQRQSINKAAREAKGKYIMKLDAHCSLDEGFDVKLAADCEYDWTVIPRMYNLDVKTWLPKLKKRTDYMYIGFNEKNQLRSLYYSGNEWKRQHRKTEELDDTMGCMGPCFFMHKDRFWELGGCDEGHGSWGSQGIEVACKAWLSGGRLVVNKKTWFAHWFRAGDGGFPYPISQSDVDGARIYAENLWLQDKWPLQKRQFGWLLEKFNPPGWENYMKRVPEDKKTALNVEMYHHIHVQRNHPKWKGATIIKMPSDMWLYAEVIQETKPDFIVEIGTKFGGSSLFFQDMLDLNGKGKVITIDVKPQDRQVTDPRITYLVGNSIAPEIVAKVKELVGKGTVMLVVDGLHERKQVKWELHHYSPLVPNGGYIVLEDCYSRIGTKAGPGDARDWFLARNKGFIDTHLDDKFLVGFCRDGWLKRI